MTFKENETCARSRTQWLVLIILTQLSGRCVSGYIGCKACRRRVASNGSSRVFSSGTTAAASGCYWHWICSTGSFQSLLKGFLLLCVSWWGPVHLCNPALFGSGLGLWWLITIHLAAAVNIDSSRDFQFEPCDILWNITKCVEVRKEIGRKGGQVWSPGTVDHPPPLIVPLLMLIYLFNSCTFISLGTLSGAWARLLWVLRFVFGLSRPLISHVFPALLCVWPPSLGPWVLDSKDIIIKH